MSIRSPSSLLPMRCRFCDCIVPGGKNFRTHDLPTRNDGPSPFHRIRRYPRRGESASAKRRNERISVPASAKVHLRTPRELRKADSPGPFASPRTGASAGTRPLETCANNAMTSMWETSEPVCQAVSLFFFMLSSSVLLSARNHAWPELSGIAVRRRAVGPASTGT